MNEADLLHTLRASADAQRGLEMDFDFRVAPLAAESRLFRLRDGTACEIIATDASGGEYALCDARSLPARPLLYASSEGQAGVMARSLESGLSVIIDLPYWQDCLKFSAGGQLAEMRRVVPLSESDLVAQTPHFASRRQAMRTLFDLSPISDSVRELHSAVVEISPLYAACGTDGWQFESLFGRFNVMQNGEWRRRLSLEA